MHSDTSFMHSHTSCHHGNHKNKIDGDKYADKNDKLDGTDGDDIIHGFTGNDIINAGAGDDYACGGPGDDIIDGGEGNDILCGGPDNNILAGGPDKDQFNFKPAKATNLIKDFEPNEILSFALLPGVTSKSSLVFSASQDANNQPITNIHIPQYDVGITLLGDHSYLAGSSSNFEFYTTNDEL
jgi:Ca2+-binding RTX toxin-like protein